MLCNAICVDTVFRVVRPLHHSCELNVLYISLFIGVLFECIQFEKTDKKQTDELHMIVDLKFIVDNLIDVITSPVTGSLVSRSPSYVKLDFLNQWTD